MYAINHARRLEQALRTKLQNRRHPFAFSDPEPHVVRNAVPVTYPDARSVFQRSTEHGFGYVGVLRD